VRCLARSTRKLAARRWAPDPNVEMLEADLDDVESTAAAARGCGPAYYLVHSMVSTGSGYAETDRRMARTFAQAAERAGISRIIYLGGLGEAGVGLSKHLASRREVEAMLASGSVPVTVFRAGMVIGAGSASFEILRYLVERLPLMVTREALDFWRVTAVEAGRRLALRAKMKLPGEALLEFTIEPLPGETPHCRLVQPARFLPRGLLGLAYWYAVMPRHGMVFGRMLRGVRRVAEAVADDDGGVNRDPHRPPHSGTIRRR
jgi:hypothetical protein